MNGTTPLAATSAQGLTRYLRRRRLIDRAMRVALFLCAALSIFVTTAILVILVRESWSSFAQVPLSDFLFDAEWTTVFAKAPTPWAWRGGRWPSGWSRRPRSRVSTQPKSWDVPGRRETMVLAIAAGQNPNLTGNLPKGAAMITAHIVQMSLGGLPQVSLGYTMIFAACLALFLITLLSNIAGLFLRRSFREAY